METWQKVLLGGGVVAGLGLIIYKLSDDGKDSPSAGNLLRVDQTITILKDLKKELGSVYITISTFANSIIERSQGRIPVEALKEILTTQTPIQSFITKAETKVYELHGITERDLKNAVDVYAKSNEEVKKLIEEMKQNLEFAYKGITAPDDTPLPSSLTPDMILKVLFEIYDSGKYTTYKHLTAIKSRGVAPNPNNPEFLMAIQNMETEAEEEKSQIFTRLGLDQFEDAPMALLKKAQTRFSQQDPAFKQKLAMIEEEYSYSMGLIMEDKFPQTEVQRLINKFGPIDF
jgi:hypothetical protein